MQDCSPINLNFLLRAFYRHYYIKKIYFKFFSLFINKEAVTRSGDLRPGGGIDGAMQNSAPSFRNVNTSYIFSNILSTKDRETYLGFLCFPVSRAADASGARSRDLGPGGGVAPPSRWSALHATDLDPFSTRY